MRRGFGHHAAVAAWSELPDGTYNAAYSVTIAGHGADLVLKVAPDPRLRLLTYEVDLMRTEVDFYRRAAAAGVPAPEVIFADFQRDLLETDYVFLSRVPGVPLSAVRERMPQPELADVRAELAEITARLHSVTGAGFGYPLRRSRTWQPTWPGAFGAIVDDVVADARRLESELPATPERIGALIHRHADVLHEVARPSLVHFDLWDSNVFVEAGADGNWRVSGLIDGERAFLGDPVAELVSLALYRDVADVPDVLTGYVARAAEAPGWLSVAESGEVELTDAGRRRLVLYTTYLYLIMAIEGVTRGFGGPEYESFRNKVLDLLDVQLGALGRRPPA